MGITATGMSQQLNTISLYSINKQAPSDERRTHRSISHDEISFLEQVGLALGFTFDSGLCYTVFVGNLEVPSALALTSWPDSPLHHSAKFPPLVAQIL